MSGPGLSKRSYQLRTMKLWTANNITELGGFQPYPIACGELVRNDKRGRVVSRNCRIANAGKWIVVVVSLYPVSRVRGKSAMRHRLRQ